MTLEEAIEVVVARTKHERYRWLCSDENPDAWSREGYRLLMLELAGAPAPTPTPTPEDLALRAYVAKHGGCCGG